MMSASITCRCRAIPARCQAAKASVSASPHRSAPALPACSTCWTSRPSAFTSATMSGSWRPSAACAISATQSIVVEHDEDAVRTADYVVDIGPAAGIHGGRIIASGTPADIMASKESITGKYLTGEYYVPVPPERRPIHKSKRIKVVNARGNNLKGVTAEIPLGCFTAVTGVSGGGKSTFLIETLFAAASRRIMGSREHPAEHDRIEGLEFIDKVIDIDQSPIGRTPRSNPATYNRRLHADPRLVRRPSGIQGARLPARPLLVQRQGRALRGLARVMASSRSKCTSCQTSMSPATSATANATTAKRSTWSSRANPSPMCST